jgi:transcriptional regulator with XRE-family HTH domain
MGSASRARPKLLSKKLREIRAALNLSQTEMGKKLGLDNEFARNYVSGYERGTREPVLEILLRYSEISGCWINALVDDAVDLPPELPAQSMQAGIRKGHASKAPRNQRPRANKLQNKP